VNKSSHVINFSVIIVLVLGTLKSILKDDALPSIRFFFGTGIMWLFLSAMGEFEDEIAKTLALVIATVVVLRDGGDVLNHYLGVDSTSALGLSNSATENATATKHARMMPTGALTPVIQPRRQAQPGAVVGQPGTLPAK